MNLISCYKLLLILTTQAIHFSEQIKRIDESTSVDACKGNDVKLVWDVDEGKGTIRKLEWYFNNKTICNSSPVDAFTVKPSYQGRIERIDKTMILMKNVSIDDDGIYVLFPVYFWSPSQKIQKTVHILEPPTNTCTCNMGHPPDFPLEQTESYCGKPKVSLLWKRMSTLEVLGDGNLILNSTLQDKEVLCCQYGEAVKCVDNNEQFCTRVSIPYRDNERSSEDGNKKYTDSVTMPGTDTGSTNIHHIETFALATLIVCILTILLILVQWIIFCKIRKKKKDPVDRGFLDELGLETREAITVHRPMNDSESNIEIQNQ